jgi:hypothetical protein
VPDRSQLLPSDAVQQGGGSHEARPEAAMLAVLNYLERPGNRQERRRPWSRSASLQEKGLNERICPVATAASQMLV